jgi:hypothetical protein
MSLLAALLLSQAGPAQQSVTLHETTTGPGANTTAITYFTPEAMKRSSSDGTDSIVRLTDGKIISIDNKKKTYTVTTVEEIQQIIKKAAAEMGGQDAEAMAAMRKMMGAVASSFSVTPQGAGENVAGYATQKYQLNGPIAMELWAAPELKLPAAYYDALKMRTPPNPMFDMSKMYDEMKKVDGMVLKSVMTMKMMGREMTTTTLVTSVDKGPIPPSTFEIPAGYKQKKLGED